MNILFNTYPQAFHSPGGGEIQLLKYKEFLSKFGNKVNLFDQWNPNFRDAEIVHYFSCQGGGVHFCNFVKGIGLPLIVSPNLWIKEETKNLYGCDDIRQQFCLSDRIICNSNVECKTLARIFNLPDEWFSTVYNGVDDVFFNYVSPNLFREQYGIYGPFLLNVANIEPRKNQLMLINLLKEFPDFKLVLIGYERDHDYAKRCFVEGGDQIRYLGPLPHASPLLRSAYAACEAFVLPSTIETPGLAALEATAIGAKLVVTAEGSTKEYFGEGAIYVDPNDAYSVIEGISKALATKTDPLTSFAIRSSFTWRHVLDDLTNVYGNLLGQMEHPNKYSGFNQIERDADTSSLFSWTKDRLDFKMRSGVLRCAWRSMAGAKVDIFLDGNLERSCFVGTDWHPFDLKISSASPNESVDVSIVVNINERILGGDSRVLGVAFRDVTLEESAIDIP